MCIAPQFGDVCTGPAAVLQPQGFNNVKEIELRMLYICLVRVERCLKVEMFKT